MKKNILISCLVIIVTLIIFTWIIVGIELILRDVEYSNRPALAEIAVEFESYERTDNTVLDIRNKWLNFGYFEIDLDSLSVKGVSTGDWFIYNNKLYFSFYEDSEDKRKCCSIFQCDFYGENIKKISSVNINKTDSYKMVEVFDNAFYISNGTTISNGTKLDVIYPLDNRQEEIAYNGNAWDYVAQLKQQVNQQYIIIKENKKEIVIRDETTHLEYTINEETMINSEEGKSLLKFDNYLLKCTISCNRILVTARVAAKNTLYDAYITFEYDINNNNLIFQNYCEENREDFFSAFGY